MYLLYSPCFIFFLFLLCFHRPLFRSTSSFYRVPSGAVDVLCRHQRSPLCLRFSSSFLPSSSVSCFLVFVISLSHYIQPLSCLDLVPRIIYSLKSTLCQSQRNTNSASAYCVMWRSKPGPRLGGKRERFRRGISITTNRVPTRLD